MAVPPGAVPGLLDPQQRSGWQLALQVWQDSGVTWELGEAEPSGPELPAPGLAETAAAGRRPRDKDPDRIWFDDADPIEPEFADPALAGRAPAAAESTRTWLDDAALADSESAGRQPATTSPFDARPGSADSADDADPGDSEPADPEPGSGEPARAEPAGTWFDGAGPADPRLAARRSVRDRPTVVELARPSFADSGVVPPEPEIPAAAVPRQPTFTPADNSRLPHRDRARPGSARDDGQRPPRPAPPRPAPARPAPARPNQLRPEPGPGQGSAQADRIRSGTDQAGCSRRREPGWDEYPANGLPSQAWPVGSGQVPLSAPVMVGAAATAGFAGHTLPSRGGGVPLLSDPDELFRAWQGSVREAAAPRRPWPASRPAGPSRRRRAVQVATIGVPAAIIVTVGAGALLMLTGKANEMLAPRSDAGAASPASLASPAASAATASLPPSGKAVPPAFAGALAGYPGQRGTVTVASIQMVGGTALAVGAADGHPAIWRRPANGTWTLESAATLGAVAGRASLAAAAYGQAGWIAVGAVSGTAGTQPLVLTSADGVTWRPAPALAALAGKGTEFLGIAAGHGGYVAVGRQMAGGRIFAVLWYSADLRSWTLGSNGGLDGRLAASTVNAVAATSGGFVAVGSHGATPAIWTSSDGKHWNLINVSLAAGARGATHSATLSSVAVSGSHVVAAGYANTPAGEVPVLVASVDGGAHWRQIALPAPDGPGVITALTATPHGFTAAGLMGKGSSARTVTLTSPDGLAWSHPTQAADGEITALTAAGADVIGASERGSAPAVVTAPAP